MPKNIPNIFLDSKSASTYFSKHKINYQKLDNGIDIITICRHTLDSFHSSINFSFSSGSAFDPPGKHGLHHLTEHLINTPIRQIASKNLSDINASTSYFSLKQFTSGPANLKYSNLGIFAVLDSVKKSLSNPLDQYTDPQEQIDTEKQTVISEHNGYQNDYNFLLEDFLNKLFFAPSNPFLSYLSENNQTIQSITKADIDSLIKKVFVSQKLTISCLLDSDYNSSKVLLDKLVLLFKNFPKAKKAISKPDYQLLNSLNSDLNTPNIYHQSCPLKNNTVEIVIFWPVKLLPYSPTDLAFGFVRDYFNSIAFNLIRSHGWAYISNTKINGHGDQNSVLSFSLRTTRNTLPKLKKLATLFKNELLKAIQADKINIDSLYQSYRRKYKLIPITQKSRLDYLLFGQNIYDQMIDLDLVDNIRQNATSQNLAYFFDLVTRNTPSVAIFGDIKS